MDQLNMDTVEKTVDHKIRKYEEYLHKREYAKKTIESYTYGLRNVLEYLHKKEDTCLQDARQDQITRYSLELTRPQQQNLKKVIYSYSKYLNTYLGKEKLNFDIQLKKKKTREKRIITLEHLERLREACREIKDPSEYMRHLVVLELALSTACRVSELTEFKWSDIDYSNNTILVRDSKGNKDRKACLTPRCIEVLNKYREHPSTVKTGEEDYIISKFRYSDDKSDKISNSLVQEVLHKLSEIAGIEPHFTVHDIRRGVATVMAESGMNLYHLQQFLGHSNPETTAQYLRLDFKKANRELVNKHPFKE